MTGNHNSGNPNIIADTLGKSTGPTTEEGKLKMLIKRGARLTEQSKILKKVRRCDKCPLGPYEKEIVNKFGRIIKIKVPAVCSMWEEGKKTCAMSINEQVRSLKAFYESDVDGNIEEAIAERIAQNALMDSEGSRGVEVMKKGHTAGYTDMHENRALKAVEMLHKMKYGEKHSNVNVNVDMNEIIREAYKQRKADESKETKEE